MGATRCEKCPKILAIAPLIPIIPSFDKDVHRQWQSYNAFSFAFVDMTDLNYTMKLDDQKNLDAMKIIDVEQYFDRLADIPKLIMVSSNDEYMSMDWTQIYWDKIKGEKHLQIIQDTDHSGVIIPALWSNHGPFIRSIIQGHGADKRPSFTQSYNNATGDIIISVPEEHQQKLKKVELVFAETVQSERRDFRWGVAGPADGSDCKSPYLPLPKGLLLKMRNKYEALGDDAKYCLQPIIWWEKKLMETTNGSGTYLAQAPKPNTKGHYVGYYVKLVFEADTPSEHGFGKDYTLTSVGWTNPNTLPFEDCHGDGCIGRLV